VEVEKVADSSDCYVLEGEKVTKIINLLLVSEKDLFILLNSLLLEKLVPVATSSKEILDKTIRKEILPLSIQFWWLFLEVADLISPFLFLIPSLPSGVAIDKGILFVDIDWVIWTAR